MQDVRVYVASAVCACCCCAVVFDRARSNSSAFWMQGCARGALRCVRPHLAVEVGAAVGDEAQRLLGAAGAALRRHHHHAALHHLTRLAATHLAAEDRQPAAAGRACSSTARLGTAAAVMQSPALPQPLRAGRMQIAAAMRCAALQCTRYCVCWHSSPAALSPQVWDDVAGACDHALDGHQAVDVNRVEVPDGTHAVEVEHARLAGRSKRRRRCRACRPQAAAQSEAQRHGTATAPGPAVEAQEGG